MSYSRPQYPVLLFLLCFSSLASAQETLEGYFQLRGGLGAGWLSSEEATLGVSGYENDKLEESNELGLVATLGAGRVFLLSDEDEDWRWFPALVASLDGAYQFETTLSGDAVMYGDPDYDNYQYHADIENLNLMFNLTLAIAEYQRWTTFVIGGIGTAWTWVEYSDKEKSDIPIDSRIELESETNTTFAWQGGVGIGYEIMPELDVTLTYLYSDFGNVLTSSDLQHRDADDDNIRITAAELDLTQQTLMLGFTWNIL